MNQKSTDNNVGKFSSFTKAKIFIVVLILIILLPSLVVGYKIFNYKKQDEMYNNAISLKYEMKYDSAEKIFLDLGGFKDSEEQIKLIDKEYVEEFAKLAGTIYSEGLSSWIGGGSYSSTFSEYDKDSSALFVSRFSSISAIQVEMQRIKKSINDSEKEMSTLQNVPSAYSGSYDKLMAIFNNCKSLYEIIENPMLYYYDYNSEWNKRYENFDKSVSKLTDFMKQCKNYESFNDIYQQCVKDTLEQSKITTN